VVIAYAGDSGGKIVKQSIEGGLFTKFIGTDGLRDEALIADIGAEALATSFFSAPTSPADNPNQAKLHEALQRPSIASPPTSRLSTRPMTRPFLRCSLSSRPVRPTAPRWPRRCARLHRLPAKRSARVNGPRPRQLIAEGKDIDYDGAGGTYDFDENGDVAGYIGKFVVDGDVYKQIAIVE
jgi:branched-chain amino acid transport system substrate-binding protein